MEDRQTTVRILVHLHGRLDEVRAQRTFGYLQLAILKRYAIVVTNDAFFLDAQSFGKVHTGRRDERAAFL
ncbi:MAG: hypothetical protein ABSE20_28390, partial [Acetobacteraceae bacterium]